MAKKEKIYSTTGKEICGAKTKSKFKGDKVTPRTNKICHRSPMANGRCQVHGGKATGPKNSIAYYRKTLLGNDSESLDIENPMDLAGEVGLVRTLLKRMADDPLHAYCQDCRKEVYVEITCPHKDYDNRKRIEERKKPVDHYVSVKSNDYNDMVKATKLLSDIVKNYKEIERGKEVTIKIEIINFVITKVVEAYEKANSITDPAVRRRTFIEGVDRLLLESVEVADAGRVPATQER